ncbi:MAG: DUF2203 domain-containing protein [Chloroflexaceae bacterium]|nr:DUF2203 domain-containing protein [Chloroflexaceae bacterium]
MDDPTLDLAEQLAEQQRLNAWLRNELQRQRQANTEIRKAVAELARTFQAALAATVAAGEAGDLPQMRQLARENQRHWQAYLHQIATSNRPAATTTDTAHDQS